MDGFQDFVCVSDLDKPFQQKPVGDLRANIAVLARTIPF